MKGDDICSHVRRRRRIAVGSRHDSIDIERIAEIEQRGT
jgi:hypothetical protein